RALPQLTRVTGGPGVAFSAAYARAVLAGLVQVDQVDVLAAERAIIASHFRGSRAAYRRALARSRATEALAREVIADEVRQQRMGRRFRVGAPTAEEITSTIEGFADRQAGVSGPALLRASRSRATTRASRIRQPG